VVNNKQRLKLAMAMAVTLPCTSLSAQAEAAASTGLTQQDIASLPPMVMQKDYASQHAQHAQQAADIAPVQQSQAVVKADVKPEIKPEVKAEIKPASKVDAEVASQQVFADSAYDLFPPVRKYYQPDPAYKNVRWDGEIQGESDKRTPDNSSSTTESGNRNSTSRAFLRKMVAMALAHSPEIRSSQADVLAAGYAIDQTKGQRWPQVQVGLSTPLANQGSEATTRNNTKISDSSASVAVTTPIFDWGKISNQVGSAEESMNAAIKTQDYTKEQLAYSTVSELINLARYQQNRLVALAYVKRMKQLADMLEQITAADKGRASEYVQAKAKLLSARASLDDIQHQLSTSRIKLVRLLGVEPNLPEGISWQDAELPPSKALAALNKNPSLLSLQAQVKAAEYEAESIQSASLPQINWTVSKDTAKDVNGDENGWYTGVNVQWNVFSGGSQKAAQMAARAKANGAQQQYEVAYRDLEYQINNMVQTRDSSFIRADDFDRLSVETARVSQMFYDQWYNLGQRTLLDVLTAENDHYNNQLSAINNRYDGYMSNMSIMASAAMLLNWLDVKENN